MIRYKHLANNKQVLILPSIKKYSREYHCLINKYSREYHCLINLSKGILRIPLFSNRYSREYLCPINRYSNTGYNVYQ
eukprot:Pgem_evm1s17864